MSQKEISLETSNISNSEQLQNKNSQSYLSHYSNADKAQFKYQSFFINKFVSQAAFTSSNNKNGFVLDIDESFANAKPCIYLLTNENENEIEMHLQHYYSKTKHV